MSTASNLAPKLAREAREPWLMEAIWGGSRLPTALSLVHLFHERAKVKIPDDVRVSVSWMPNRRYKTKSIVRSMTIGMCLSEKLSAKNRHELMILPALSDSVTTLGVLVHEIVHAAVGTDAGHGARFANVAKPVGLTGQMTATVPGDELRDHLDKMVKHLGEYPHAAVTPPRPRDHARLLKAYCGNAKCVTYGRTTKRAGYTMRVTSSWIKDFGLPDCPACGRVLVCPEYEDDEGVHD